MRIFVALPLPDPVLDALQALQQGLPVGRAMRRNTLHLTLAFVGEHPEPAVQGLHEELERIGAPGFDLRLSGLGTFGRTVPTVLWAGVERQPALDDLYQQVASAIRRAGLTAPPVRFRPHVTIARFRPDLAPAPQVRLDEFTAARAGFRAPPFWATGFNLFQSHLHPEGAQHEALASYPLGPN